MLLKLAASTRDVKTALPAKIIRKKMAMIREGYAPISWRETALSLFKTQEHELNTREWIHDKSDRKQNSLTLWLQLK